MTWEDDLKAKLKTPEQRQAEDEKRRREEHAAGCRAASDALSEARRAFFKAQQLLAVRFSSSMSVMQTGEDSSLEFPGHILSVKRAEDGTGVIFSCDGEVTRLVFRSANTFAVDGGVTPMTPSEFGTFVGRKVSAIVT